MNPEAASPILALPADREEEERLARERSLPSRLLGIAILAFQALGIVAGFFGWAVSFDILAIVAGFGVLRGSQAWLRFMIFMTSLAAVALWVELIPALFQWQPVESEFGPAPAWLDPGDLRFWTHHLPVVGFETAMAVLGVIALKGRLLVFWTRAARRWGGGMIGLVVVLGIWGLVDQLLELRDRNAFEGNHPAELEAIEDALSGATHAHGFPVMHELDAFLDERLSVAGVVWHYAPRGRRQIYQLGDGGDDDNREPDYAAFRRDGAGDWGRIEIHLAPGAAP